MRRRRSGQRNGQALVEFSLAVIVFLVLLMGIFDFGRGIYMYNGVAQAAREIARRTSVYPGIDLGASQQSQAVIAVQRSLVPGMEEPDFACLTITGATSPSDPCTSGDVVQVTVTATYAPITPLLSFLGTIPLTASGSAAIPG